MAGAFADTRDAFLEIDHLKKVYTQGLAAREPFVALEDINLKIGHREFVSVVGPSGCGKSTMLRCIAGLEAVSGGTIRVNDQVISGPPDKLGIVFQGDTLADWRTVLENVLFVSEIRRLNRKEMEPRARALLEMFGLGNFADSRPWELSGGMRQRAAICRALVDDPEFLLMDEPFGALDAMTRDQLNVELQRIWLGSRKTVLFITHGIAEAVFLSDRVIVMSRNPGRIVRDIAIDLGRPRPLAIRETPEFGGYVREIRDVFLSLGILKD